MDVSDNNLLCNLRAAFSGAVLADFTRFRAAIQWTGYEILDGGAGPGHFAWVFAPGFPDWMEVRGRRRAIDTSAWGDLGRGSGFVIWVSGSGGWVSGGCRSVGRNPGWKSGGRECWMDWARSWHRVGLGLRVGPGSAGWLGALCYGLAHGCDRGYPGLGNHRTGVPSPPITLAGACNF